MKKGSPGEKGGTGRQRPAHPVILVIGLGNPILGDDGVGWRIAERVGSALQALNSEPPAVEVDCLSLGGLGLMERMLGYERVVVIDAVTSGKHPPGTVTCMALEDLPDPGAGHTSSAHDTSLQNAIAVGRLMGAQLPGEIRLVLVEIEPVSDFCEELSQPVEASIPAAEQYVQHILDSWLECS
jgi:hydrogenase maturation protease